MKKMTMAITVMLAMLFMTGSAAAVGDILIHPDDPTITVPVDPNAVSPPLEIEYVGWGTAGSTTYSIIVSKPGFIPPGCSVGGTLTTDPQTVTLPGCKIPASDVGVEYHVYASAACPTGGCEGTSRSRELTVDAPLNPVPEIATIGLVSAGLIGLVFLRRKN